MDHLLSKEKDVRKDVLTSWTDFCLVLRDLERGNSKEVL